MLHKTYHRGIIAYYFNMEIFLIIRHNTRVLFAKNSHRWGCFMFERFNLLNNQRFYSFYLNVFQYFYGN